MKRAFSSRRKTFLASSLVLILLCAVLGGCSQPPAMSYQGKLTDASGHPLDGTYTFIFSLFSASTGGTALYTETKDIVVSDGFFDTSVGPYSVTSDMDVDWLTGPLWLEVTINGEVLTPRQRLLGSPYAFTLMPGAKIATTLSVSAAGTVTDAVLTVANKETSNPVPALRVEGAGGLEVVGVDSSDTPANAGLITGLRSSAHSDLVIASMDELYIDIDENNNSGSYLRIRNGANAEVCTISENGDLSCIGNLHMTGTKSSLVKVEGQQYELYALESPEVWFEDFGSGALVDGVGRVTIDPLFAAGVNLSEYLVFVTPLGDCQGLYVTHKTPDGFEVRELSGGHASIDFDYRLVARRLGYEALRMETFEATAEEGE